MRMFIIAGLTCTKHIDPYKEVGSKIDLEASSCDVANHHCHQNKQTLGEKQAVEILGFYS